jgi:uncharacterized protein YjbJ (UPF0337 family)
MNVNKDQVEGRINVVEGKIKEIAGKVTGDEKLAVKGKIQGVVGEAQAKFGDVRQDVEVPSKSGT